MLDFIFIVLSLFQLEDSTDAVVTVLEVGGVQAEVVGNVVYFLNETPRRIVVKLDDIFEDGFEGGDL